MTKDEFKIALFRLVPALCKRDIPLHEMAWDAAAVLFVQGLPTVDDKGDVELLREQIRFMAKNGHLDLTQ